MAERKDRRGLGRGLSALMADIPSEEGSAPPRRPDQTLPIENVAPNPDQPRRRFDEDELNDLASSIRARGIIQPIIVRPDPGKSNGYQIVAGERRWRAAQKAGLHDIPVLIRNMDDLEVLEIAIVENIQRADLNPIEEAAGYATLMERFGHTQEKLAQGLGRSRSHIANSLRLLTLPPEVHAFVEDGSLSAGHARTLVTSEDPVRHAREIVTRGLSVRDAEKLAKSRSGRGDQAGQNGRARNSKKDADTLALEGDLSAALGMRVSIEAHPAGEGRISINYKSLDQLDGLCEILGGGLPDKR
jgi:ParB family chromosome partitioning protein